MTYLYLNKEYDRMATAPKKPAPAKKATTKEPQPQTPEGSGPFTDALGVPLHETDKVIVALGNRAMRGTVTLLSVGQWASRASVYIEDNQRITEVASSALVKFNWK